MRNNFFIKTICVLIGVIFLTFSVGKVTSVFALAELAPEVAPVFDTQMYQLSDYVDNSLTDPQLEIFYVLGGLWGMSQLGSNHAMLGDPYTTQDGVIGWLKSTGIQIYNAMMNLASDYVRLPDGSLVGTSKMKELTTFYVASMMGAAVKSATYSDMDDFIDDVTSSTSYYLPWDRKHQIALNTVFGTRGGAYDFQFDVRAWHSNVEYHSTNAPSLILQQDYHDYLLNLTNPVVRFNSSDTFSEYNNIFSSDFFNTFTNLFIDTTNHVVNFKSDLGQSPSGYYFADGYARFYYTGSNNWYFQHSESEYLYPVYVGPISFNSSDYQTYDELVQKIYDGILRYDEHYLVFFEDWIQHVYVGPTWGERSEIYNLRNLNYSVPESQYYDSLPDDNDYLLDIKGILTDLVNETDLFDVYIRNVITPDGVPVHDTDLIRVTTSIYDLIQDLNPPLPVDLNDIATYTDNTYLEKVKENARNFGDTFVNYIFFWHNCDAELVYVCFGAAIVVLIGAFVGKWGHS